jgi:hypothetical protein
VSEYGTMVVVMVACEIDAMQGKRHCDEVDEGTQL